mgnify:CR=1 FL=1
MYKHSTTHRTLSRRLAALLAVLALLAALALPVYAEAQSKVTTQIAETVETVNETETTDDTTASTDSDDPTDTIPADPTDDSTTAADDATDDTTTSADDTNTTPAGETTTDDTLDTSDEDTNNDGTDGANIENTGTADDAVAQPDNEVEDEVRVQEAAAKEVTIYFLAPSGFDTTATVKFHARIQGEQNNDNWYTAQMTDSGKADRNGRKIFFTTVYPEQRPSCPYSGYSKIEFITSTANGDTSYWGLGQNSLEWTSVYTYADQIYDADAGTWTAYTPFDPNNHQTFAGKTMLFQNQSNTNLANVQAVFCEKTNNGLQPVETIDLKAIATGKRVSFKIPEKDCTYIRFIVDGKETSLYNFYDQQDEGANNRHFLYDSGTACYVYKENDNGSSWTIPQGKITVYFDATFSSAYTEYNGAALSIPNGESKDVYCCFKNDSEGTTSNAQKMTSLGNNLYSVEVPGGYSEIMFSGDSRTSPVNSGVSTDWVPIDWSLDKPCYMADTNDAVVYNNNAPRGGYWIEKDAIRDAEAGKGTTVVDIDKTTSFVRDSATKYVTTTLYDYYTDWELNGNNRDDYDKNFDKSHRSWVPFRQFDLALSDYYKTSGKSSNVLDAVTYPIYTGHFQPSEYNYYNFLDLYNQLQMNLFGFDEGRKFMVDNNSSLCMDTNDNSTDHYNCTVQGIVADKATNTSKDGLPVMRGTETSAKPLVEPHFNTEFLLGTNSKHTKLGEVYENVAFPFTQNDVFSEGIKYWSFDAAETTLYLKQDKDDDSYFLQSSKNEKASKNRGSDSGEKDETGFFPFNETVKDGASANNYNYGFGARLQVDFTLTDDGMVVGTDGKKPIKFFFSGDDDVWVFIDGKLALDVGGAHEKASGLLVFNADKSSEYATPYVSNVKAGGTSGKDVRNGSKLHVEYKASSADNASKIPIDFSYEGDKIKLEKGKTHTLTMYYMERGMWESNMAIAFNFPDHNELQVEKKVDLGDVKDPEFAACFTNQKLFNFTILNQATHYGPMAVDEGSVQQVPPKKLSSNDYTLGRMGNLVNNNSNYCRFDEDPEGENPDKVIHWYAEYDDTHSNFRNDRMGVITLDKSVDITGMDYLSFYIYASGIQGEGTLSLSNMYLQLVDSGGKVRGCIDKESLSGTTYNQVDPKNNEWIKVKLDLSRLTKDSKFDMTQLKEIRIGDNFQRHIYFKDFTFTANPTIKKITGFTTEQKDIPDYGSAADGELKLAESAQFSSSIDGETHAVDENGQFTLQDKEVVTFSDQFRRGSYLSVTEDADPALFDTTWTIYENGVQVKNMNPGKTVQNADPAPSVVEQPSYTPNDGRTEKTSTDIGLTGDGNSYNGKKPNGEAIVFRSYTNPDAGEAAELTKLKLQFVNKVKTGSLTIRKEAAAGEQGQIGSGEYTFTVTFANVGGLGLESKPIVKEVEITGVGEKTITGIPVGTRFHIVETSATNNANVSSVTVSGGRDCKVVNGKEAIGSIVEYKQDDPNTVAVATFTNTTRTLIDINLTKKWVDADNKELPDVNLPRTIYVQLQRKTETALKWEPVVDGTGQNYVEVNRDQGGWTHTFANLDADDYRSETKPVYQYRVVEGTLSAAGEFEAKDTLLLSDGHTYTCEDGVMKSTTTADGKTSNTITLTNKRLNPKFNLDITKADAEDGTTPLKDVEFTLEKLDEKNNVVEGSAKYGITNNLGKLMSKGEDGKPTDASAFTGLEAGKYRLTETKAAENYNLLSAPIEVEFTKTGQCLLNGAAVKVSTTDEPTDFTKNGNDRYTLALTVLNRKTPALPHTGADAPSLWLLIGLPLAVAGLLILVFRYNKKGGRTR